MSPVLLIVESDVLINQGSPVLTKSASLSHPQTETEVKRVFTWPGIADRQTNAWVTRLASER